MSDNNKDKSCRSSSSSGGTSEVLFRWPDSGGASNVCVSGAWCGWSETGTRLSSAEDKDGRVLFSGTVLLPRGNHKFRFVVDGEWRHDPKLPTERDEATGEVCNVVKVSPKGDLRVRLPEQGTALLGGGGGGGQQDDCLEQASQATRMARVMMSRRRREVEASSLAAVGACLVSSSVRKDGKLIVAMVGLPGRGKSFVARSILRHLDWMGLKSRIFSTKDRRRKEIAVYEPVNYFDAGGEGEKIRERLAAEMLAEALEALQSDIDIAIYDASNINSERRRVLNNTVAASGLHAKVVFIESICKDEELVRRNIVAIQESSPEYVQKTVEEVERDVRSRIERYERIYEPLDAEEGDSFIKLIDAGSQMVTNLISGYIPGRITLLCLNLHLKPRPIWMSRHGESEFNMQGRIGGDAPLTAAGKVYAGRLDEFMSKLYPPRRKRQGDAAASACGPDGGGGGRDGLGGRGAGGGEGGGVEGDNGEDLVVWTSTMLRTGQTVAPMTLHREVMKWSQLTEINAGLMDSLTYEHVAAEMPAEYEARQKDKLRYR
ncbi:conserved unknown protein [Ectocarpus siliculosus]|uniref:AMP-activated protein kinase glycogen-binding domain-containing protein n=1 Tax=Ectocarpus siliculosus TaxID=2880 RepID=D7G2J6_ECTSI|nr:conserved unknown protein [Ectocarpus siliculosus]|eukprot:CBJ26821.1 conserved unknown protein [Ectocarpus siliculosus]